MVYPNWFEWRHPSGDNFYEISDPYNEFVVPYTTSNNGDTLYYTRVDGLGPENWTSGWYYGATPGNYNWDSAEDFYDLNGDGIYNASVDGFNPDIHDIDGNGVWTAPEMVESAAYRDGSYWLLPEMYIDYTEFADEAVYLQDLYLDPYYSGNVNIENLLYSNAGGDASDNPYYFLNWS